jgi:hypothetical protein
MAKLPKAHETKWSVILELPARRDPEVRRYNSQVMAEAACAELTAAGTKAFVQPPLAAWKDKAEQDRERIRDAAPELLAALDSMLNTHGKPMREEWMSDAAFEHCKRVHDQARAAVAKARGQA